MEEKKSGSGHSGTAQRKNFMKPEIEPDQVLKKREEFAVNLRKKRTKDIVNQKRLKIAQALSKGHVNGGLIMNARMNENDRNNCPAGVSDTTPSDLDPNTTYSGYPKWRRYNYIQQRELLVNIFEIVG